MRSMEDDVPAPFRVIQGWHDQGVTNTNSPHGFIDLQKTLEEQVTLHVFLQMCFWLDLKMPDHFVCCAATWQSLSFACC